MTRYYKYIKNRSQYDHTCALMRITTGILNGSIVTATLVQYIWFMHFS